MAGPEAKCIQEVKATLEPYIKPREQVAYIRRVLALHLRQQRGIADGLRAPLSLIHDFEDIPQERDEHSHGAYKEYLRAVRENLKARQEYAELRQRCSSASAPDASASQEVTSDPIENHMTLVKLQQKEAKLLTFQKHLERLSQQPAASLDFLRSDSMFRGGPALPSVPKEVVNSFSTSAQNSTADLTERLSVMEKTVLRAKLQLRKEEQLLEDIKARTRHATSNVGERARFNALNATRGQLIQWIESELSKASGNIEDTNDQEDDSSPRLSAAEVDISRQIAQIRDKYTDYIAKRKLLLSQVTQQPQPTLRVTETKPATARPPEEAAIPSTHLLIPYLENLLDLSRQQKDMIQHKAHLSSYFLKQAKETRQTLSYLAEESQLLPNHPMPDALRVKSSSSEQTAKSSSEQPDTAARVKSWVFAADAARIATLEVVAEKVEEGQLALEGSMKALQAMDQLLGREFEDAVVDGPKETAEEDIWIGAESGGTARPEGHVGRHKPKQADMNDPWSALDGNLGLIGRDSPVK